MLDRSDRSSSASDRVRQRALSANHGNAQLPASNPAASAIKWLLADDPRLSNFARYSWCQRICRSAKSLCSNKSATPGHPFSRRRIQAKLIRRMPSSIPLVQLTPDRNGLDSHQDRS